MRITAVIPAKGKSVRLKNKNKYLLGGMSLVYRACERTLKSKMIHEVYLDTEDDSIIAECEPLVNAGLKIIRRPKELATNFIGANELMMWALHSVDYCDLLIQTFATSPFLTSQTIDTCIEKFLTGSSKYDSFFTVNKLHEYFWDKNFLPEYDLNNIPNSFELPPKYMETHGLYGIYTKTLFRLKRRVGNIPFVIPISKREGLDINDYEDLAIAEALL